MTRDRLNELLQRSNSVVSTSSNSNGTLLQQYNSNKNNNNEALTDDDRNMSQEVNAPVDSILKQGQSNNHTAFQYHLANIRYSFKNFYHLFAKYAEIRVQLAQIAGNLEIMNRMVQTNNLRNYNENEMDDLRNQNLKMGQQLMGKFREFKSNLPAENDYSLEARMKRTLFYGLYQSYIHIWTKNEEFLQLYERKLKKNLTMQTKIINFSATEEEIEELIANKTTNLFVGNIIEETEKERKTLRDLMDRFSELKKLEKSIEDVHCLFLRIQTLVMEQSETINRVEFHAQQATMYVDKGGDELEKAEQYHKKSIKKKVMLVTILVAVLIVLFLIVIYL